MVTIKESEFMKIFTKAVAKTYFAEIVANTPGKGIVADAWDIDTKGNNVIIYNEEFGDVVTFLEEGTKEHIIRAKDKKFLRFKKEGSKKSGKKIPGNIAFEKDGYVFAKAVHHPGTEARKFIQKALESSEVDSEFEKALESGLNKAITSALI